MPTRDWMPGGLIGTLRSYFRIGSTGPRLKNNSGVLEVKNSGDSAYASSRSKSHVFEPQSSAPTAISDGEQYYNSTGQHGYMRINNAWVQIDNQTVGVLDMLGGRLSPTTGTPVETGSVSAFSTIYYALQYHNLVTLYDGSSWSTYSTGEISVAVPSTLFRLFDVFMYLNSGVPTLETLNWNQTTGSITGATNATPVVVTSNSHGRSVGDVVGIAGMSGLTSLNGSSWVITAVTTNTFTLGTSAGNGAYTSGGTWYLMSSATRATALTRDSGRLVKSGDATRRYLGTGCTIGVSGQCDFTATRKYLWNFYNQTILNLFKQQTGVYSYQTTSWRQANANAANKLEIVTGQTTLVDVETNVHVRNTGTSTQADDELQSGIGYNVVDSSTADTVGEYKTRAGQIGSIQGQMSARQQEFASGVNFFALVERGVSIGASNTYGWGNGNVNAIRAGVMG